MRRADVLGADGRWRERDGGLAAVSAGEVFRLFEPDGSPVADEDGCSRWRLVARSADGTADAEQVPPSDAESAVAAAGVFWPSDGRRGLGRRLR